MGSSVFFGVRESCSRFHGVCVYPGCLPVVTIKLYLLIFPLLKDHP
jgi:hypothetical protein